MYGRLKKIDVTEELVLKVAEENFRELNDGQELRDQKGWIKTDWGILAWKDLDRFNDMVDTLANIKHTCEVQWAGCHDVDRFYPEDE